VNLEDVGIRGNRRQFMSEKNSAEISKFFMDWLEKNVQRAIKNPTLQESQGWATRKFKTVSKAAPLA